MPLSRLQALAPDLKRKVDAVRAQRASSQEMRDKLAVSEIRPIARRAFTHMCSAASFDRPVLQRTRLSGRIRGLRLARDGYKPDERGIIRVLLYYGPPHEIAFFSIFVIFHVTLRASFEA